MTGQVDQDELAALMHEIGVRARRAARVLATTPDARKSEALRAAAEALLASEGVILAANAADVAEAEARGTKGSFLDRLRLDPVRLKSIAEAVADIAALPDPVGRVLATWQQPNGLRFERVATPLGVIGVIFESRPNVTADAGALCLKSGNASILRAGSESFRTSEAIAHAMQDGLRAAGLPADAIQLVPTRDRAAVGHMLTGLEGAIDVIVPRGGKSLVGRVQAEARVLFLLVRADCSGARSRPLQLEGVATPVRLVASLLLVGDRTLTLLCFQPEAEASGTGPAANEGGRRDAAFGQEVELLEQELLSSQDSLRRSLSELEQRHGNRFIRIHRNALVARSALRALDRHDVGPDGSGWAVRLHGLAESLPVSRRQLAAVREAFGT
jgi:hypothetical protein